MHAIVLTQNPVWVTTSDALLNLQLLMQAIAATSIRCVCLCLASFNLIANGPHVLIDEIGLQLGTAFVRPTCLVHLCHRHDLQT